MALIYGEMQWKNKAAAQAAATPPPPLHLQLHPGWGWGGVHPPGVMAGVGVGGGQYWVRVESASNFIK